MNRRRRRIPPPSPRELVAKRPDTCAESGRPIRPGDRILWWPVSGPCMGKPGRAYLLDTRTAREWRDAEFDRTVLGRDY